MFQKQPMGITMDVEVLGSTNDQLSVIFRGAQPTFVNAIRRIIMAEIPIPAIEKVYVAENTSVLYDEILAHRLGMIPMRGGEALIPPDQCNCGGKGCGFCESVLTLEVEAKEDNVVVYSGRLKAEGSVFPANNDIPIVKLNSGQKIALVAHARLGRGKEHAKWQPVSACVIKYEPVVSIQADCDLCGICVERCPRKILEINENEKKLAVRSIWDCSLCKVCEEVCPKSAIKVSYNDKTSRLTIETTGSKSNEELLISAFDFLIKKCESLKNSIGGATNG
ncbi:MAG: DNA-directed RNA polymerase subunit D [Candidatus Methanomethylicaceae archaeon]